MKKDKYDVVVVGAGSGGLNVASFFARLRMRVLLIDKREESIGGDCLNAGCVPSKALIHTARTIKTAKDSASYGYTITGELDFKKVMDEVKKKQDYIRTHENSDYLRSKGMDVSIGEAFFVSPTSISVNGTTYEFSKCIIATGSRARELSLKHNDDSVPCINNESIFKLDTMPKDFIFLGGGPISCELGQAFSHLGSDVTILNAEARLLPREHEKVSTQLVEDFKDDGIDIVSSMTLQKIENGRVFYSVEGVEYSKKADALFIGIGRVLNIEGLALESGGVKLNEQGKLVVNEYLQTTNPNIYVVGDIAGSFMFTHAAEAHAKVVINNIMSPFKKKSPTTLAWVTYTQREVATFGKSEVELKKEGVNYTVYELSLDDEDRAITDGEQGSFLVVYLDGKGKVLGGTLMAKGAGELVQDLLTLHYNDLSVTALYNKVYPYPTKSRINRRLALQFLSNKLRYINVRLLTLYYLIFNK
jgi:pyruvate/2-oxoglutarate dehydrogenase complex dihydrolipoamide dehydrogenase (E3) component